MQIVDKFIIQKKLCPPRGVDIQFTRDNKKFYDDTYEKFISAIKKSELVLINNVAQYYYAGTDQEEWRLEEHYPNLAPPWDSFFVEYKQPTKIISNVNGEIYNPFVGMHAGILFQAIDIQEAFKRANGNSEYYMGLLNLRLNSNHPDKDLYKWLLIGTLFLWDGQHDVIGPMLMQNIMISNDGKFLPMTKDKQVIMGIFWKFCYDVNKIGLNFLSSLLNPGYLAISFLHCKNVLIKSSDQSDKVLRKYEKKYAIPKTVYKILEIEPIKQILKRDGNIETNGIKKALHICRGHFNDYTKGRGLFGKHKGIFWIPQHFRGSKEIGTIEKKYMVNRP